MTAMKRSASCSVRRGWGSSRRNSFSKPVATCGSSVLPRSTSSLPAPHTKENGHDAIASRNLLSCRCGTVHEMSPIPSDLLNSSLNWFSSVWLALILKIPSSSSPAVYSCCWCCGWPSFSSLQGRESRYVVRATSTKRDLPISRLFCLLN